jgi:hypothetical protein
MPERLGHQSQLVEFWLAQQLVTDITRCEPLVYRLTYIRSYDAR